jgi:heptosyltransferase I
VATASNTTLDLDTPPSAVCIVRLSAIGDTCHTVPVVRAIQRAWPDTPLTWIIGRTEHSLLEGLEGVRFVVLDKDAGLQGYRALRHELRGTHFPLLLHMHASMRANFASRMANAEIRLGFDKARARDYQWLFCNARLPPTPRQHVMDGLLEFAAAIGILDLEPRWDIPVSEKDRDKARQVIDATRPSLVISPCSGQRFRNYRNWSVDNYAAVADYAARHFNASVVLTGGQTEIERIYGRGIAERCAAPVTNLIGGTSLKELIAIIERASVVVCPDSGPAHMSTAVGTPVVGLYATSNRFRTGPYFCQDLVVDRYPEAVRAEFDKSVDELRFGQRVRNPQAMALITPDDVVEKLELAFRLAGHRPVNGA